MGKGVWTWNKAKDNNSKLCNKLLSAKKNLTMKRIKFSSTLRGSGKEWDQEQEHQTKADGR